jgi:hypothetical protein
VPFAVIGGSWRVRGTVHHVVVLAEGRELARHARHTAQRLVLDNAHYDGEATATVRAPTPLGHRARLQLAGIPGLPETATVARPLADYVRLIDDVVYPAPQAGLHAEVVQ